MAWIVGQVSPDELSRLRTAGWEDSDPPADMLSDEPDEPDGTEDVLRAFFVDSDVYSIMTGSGWDTPDGLP